MKLKMMNLNGIKLKLQLRLPFMIFKNSSLFGLLVKMFWMTLPPHTFKINAMRLNILSYYTWLEILSVDLHFNII